MPTVRETFQRLVDLLEAHQTPFVVIGGLAVGLQGEPRATLDVDVLVTLAPADVSKLAHAAQASGWNIDPVAATTQWRFTGFVRFFLGPRGHQVAADLMGNASAYFKEVMWRAQVTRLFDRRVPVATPEDLVVMKCSAWREKDIPDLRGLLRRHEGKLEFGHIRKWLRWFSEQSKQFEAMPKRFEALVSGAELPPAIRD
ncbi:MAG: nucleotidyltransferase [Planctomycetota bacterium]